MRPTPAALRLDGEPAEREAHTLLVEVANAPLMGPAFQVAPHARMDDALLDVAIYHDVTPAGLAARLVALKAGVEPDDARIERARTRRLELRTAAPLPVMADSKVIGTTPATFEVLPGALRVIAGHGPGLAHPVAEALLEAAVSRAHRPSAAAPAAAPPDAPAGPATAAPGLRGDRGGGRGPGRGPGARRRGPGAHAGRAGRPGRRRRPRRRQPLPRPGARRSPAVIQGPARGDRCAAQPIARLWLHIESLTRRVRGVVRPIRQRGGPGRPGASGYTPR